jgi:SHS2 domain-containing protein
MAYDVLGHTADVRLKVTAPSFGALVRDAILGMMAILRPRLCSNEEQRRTVAVEALDRTTLLVDLLNAVLLAAQEHREAYDEVQVRKLTERAAAIELYGRAAEAFGEDIKAATYHEADVHQNERGEWETVIVFDI